MSVDVPRCVLAATNLVDGLDEALLRAHHIAARHEAKLVVVHALASATSVNALFPQRHAEQVCLQLSVLDEAQDTLARHVRRVTGRAAAEVELVVTHGDPFDVVLETARAQGADLLVVGSTGNGRRLTRTRSVAQRLVRRSTIPVLVVRQCTPSSVTLGATDFSDPRVPALRAAAAWGDRLVLLHTLDYLPPQAERPTAMLALAKERLDDEAAALGVPHAETHVRVGSSRHILETAAQVGADLVVVGRRVDRRVARACSAEMVARSARCSVLVVPLGQDDAA